MPVSGGLARRVNRINLCRRKRSITSPILKDDIRENAIPRYFPSAGLEIWPFPRLFFRLFWNNAGDDAVALPKLHRVTRPEPSFQAAGVAELA
jgi:hypothetical protein